MDNGNKLIEGAEWANKSLEEIVVGTYQAGSVAQNGISIMLRHWNRSIWEMMGLEEIICLRSTYYK